MRKLIIPAIAALCGCTKVPELDRYEVVSYNAGTAEWVMIHRAMVDGKTRVQRLTLECVCSVPSFWDDRQTRYGPNACHLEVGRTMVPTRTSRPVAPNDDGKPFLAITTDNFPQFIVSERSKSTEKVHDWSEQHFSILKSEVVDHP